MDSSRLSENAPLISHDGTTHGSTSSVGNSINISDGPTTYQTKNNDTFCKRRGVFLTFCLAFLSLILLIIIIFKSQVLTLIGYKESKSQLLYKRYEQDWDTLEHVDQKYVPSYWQYDSSCDDSHTFDLTFAVKLQNAEKLDEELFKTSMPDSPNYGQHWTSAQVREFFKPKEESINEIFWWLDYHGIDESNIQFLSSNMGYIQVSVDCNTANKMLNTEFGFWSKIDERDISSHTKKNERKNDLDTMRTNNKQDSKHLRVKEGYQVPRIVRDHLDFISPTLRFPMKHHTGSVEFITSIKDSGDFEAFEKEYLDADTLNSYVTPNKLTEMYHLEDYMDPSADTTNQQAIASFLNEWFTYSDYYLFQTYFDVTRTKVTRNPSNQPDGYGDEAELDVQYVTSTGRGIDTIVYDVEDDLYFITLAERIADSDSPPYVVSISYGGSEQSNGWGYCYRASIDLGIISLLGVTIFVSSGDDGAVGDYNCDDYGEFQPSFPATSPYVVAVGGTTGGKVQADATTSTEEAAWSYSGGGFSTYFSRFDFQDSAVTDYFDIASDTLPDSDYYNSEGRAYPDISALSVYYIVCVESSLWSVSGTSCSSPAVAGMFSQINDIRLQNGLSSLGFVNPRLYALFNKDQSEYFNDVVEGYNYGCDWTDDGFYAAKGWDPVTGVGTPKMSTMAEALIVI